MSLTSFLEDEDVQKKFTEEFKLPKFEIISELKAPPLTKNYALIGTAFDYLMRFYLKRLNPNAITQEWVAEHSISRIANKKIKKIAEGIVKQAKINYDNYIKTGEINEEVLKSCIYLAQIDSVYRSGILDERMGNVESLDIQDMRNLFSLINPEYFKAKKNCLLNPTFGKGSSLVGGADTDLVIDDILIDIKTTKYLNLTREHFDQIVGYYFLSLIGKLSNSPRGHKVNHIGIYFSRHGILYKIPVEEVIKKEQVKPFIAWMKKRAREPSLNVFFR